MVCDEKHSVCENDGGGDDRYSKNTLKQSTKFLHRYSNAKTRTPLFTHAEKR
jgi:hypothetical protein